MSKKVVCQGSFRFLTHVTQKEQNGEARDFKNQLIRKAQHILLIDLLQTVNG